MAHSYCRLHSTLNSIKAWMSNNKLKKGLQKALPIDWSLCHHYISSQCSLQGRLSWASQDESQPPLSVSLLLKLFNWWSPWPPVGQTAEGSELCGSHCRRDGSHCRQTMLLHSFTCCQSQLALITRSPHRANCPSYSHVTTRLGLFRLLVLYSSLCQAMKFGRCFFSQQFRILYVFLRSLQIRPKIPRL